MINRRKVAQLLGGAPFLGQILKTNLTTRGLGANPTTGVAPPAGWSTSQSMTTGDLGADKVSSPFMSKAQALKILMLDKDFADKFTSSLYQQVHHVENIDPDLLVLKSLSPMAKITFQRQRNVERLVNTELNGQTWYDYLNLVEQNINKLRYPK